MMRRIVDTEHTKKPQHPAWNDELELKAHLTLDKICTPRFCLHFDSATIIMGAMERMKSYYESGIERGNIKNFEAWFFLKCRSAARDERQQLLGRPKDKKKKKTFISLQTQVTDAKGQKKPLQIPDLHKGEHHPYADILLYDFWKYFYASENIAIGNTFPPKTKAELERRIEYVEQHVEKCPGCARNLDLTHLRIDDDHDFEYSLLPVELDEHGVMISPNPAKPRMEEILEMIQFMHAEKVEIWAQQQAMNEEKQKPSNPENTPVSEEQIATQPQQQTLRTESKKMDILEKADQFVQQRGTLIEELEQKLQELDQQRSTIARKIAEIKGDTGIVRGKRRGRPPKQPSAKSLEAHRKAVRDGVCPWCSKKGHDARAHRAEIIAEKAKNSPKYHEYLAQRNKAA